jgi:hypothetical protein
MKWSKEKDAECGANALEAASSVCMKLAERGKINTTADEKAFKGISYALANCPKMCEKAAPRLVESFSKVMVLCLSMDKRGEECKVNEAFAKCTTNFMQSSMQIVAKFVAGKGPKDGAMCYLLSQLIHIATHPKAMSIIHVSLTSSEQVTGLSNYMLDVSLGFVLSLEAVDPTNQHARGARSITTVLADETGSKAIYKYYEYESFKQPIEVTGASGRLLSLRKQVLETILNRRDVCSYSLARVFDLLGKHLGQLVKMNTNNNASLSSSAGLLAVTEGTVLLGNRVLEVWSQQQRQQKQKGAAGEKGVATAADVVRAAMWLHEVDAALAALPQLAKKLLSASKGGGGGTAWGCARGLGKLVAAASSKDCHSAVAQTLLLSNAASSDSGGGEGSLKSAFLAMFGFSASSEDAIKWGADGTALEGTNAACLALLGRDIKECNNRCSSLYAELTAKYTEGVAKAMEFAMKSNSSGGGGEEGKPPVQQQKPPAAPRMLARCFVEGLSALSTALKAHKQRETSDSSAPTGLHSLAISVTTTVIQGLACPQIWASGYLASYTAVLRAVGNCLAQLPRKALETGIAEHGAGALIASPLRLMEALHQCTKAAWSALKVGLKRERGGSSEKVAAAEGATLLISLSHMLHSRLASAAAACFAVDPSVLPTKSAVGSGLFSVECELLVLLESVKGACIGAGEGSDDAALTKCLEYKVWHQVATDAANSVVIALARPEDGSPHQLSEEDEEATLSGLVKTVATLVAAVKPTSTSAADFASVMCQCLSTRAVEIVKSSCSTDNCMVLLQEILSRACGGERRGEHDNATNNGDNSSAYAVALELSASSSFCWASGIGPADDLATGIVERIKDLATELDGSTAPSLAAVATKRGRATKAGTKKKEDEVSLAATGVTVTGNVEDMTRVSVAVRLWVLLAQWALPSSIAAEDVDASDGLGGLCAYLSNGLSALQQVATACEEDKAGLSECSEDATAQSVLADARILHALLGMNGRRSCQVKVAAAVALICKALQQSPSCAAGSAQESHLHPLLAQASDEMLLMSQTLSAWDGILPPFVDICSAAQAAWSKDLLALIHTARDALQHGNHHADGSAAAADRFERMADSTLCAVGATTAAVAAPSAFLQAMQAWVALLASKTLMCVWARHHSALRFTKRALSLLACDKSRGGGLMTVTAEAAMPRLEAVLLVAELFEQSGQIDSSLAYISEAVSIAKVSPRAANSVVLLHSLRIWHRAGSLRLISCVSDLLNDEELLPGEQHDEVTVRVREATAVLSGLLNIGIEAGGSCSSTQARSLEDEDAVLGYRHAARMWNVPALRAAADARARGDSSSTFNPRGVEEEAVDLQKYHTCLPEHARQRLEALLPVSGTLAAQAQQQQGSAPSFSGISSSQEHEAGSALSLLGELTGCYSFDVMRDLRRRACLQAVVGEKAGKSKKAAATTAHSVLPFVLGAGSCGTSLECAVENRFALSHAGVGSHSNDSSVDVGGGAGAMGTHAHLPAASHLLRRACTGDADALRITEKSLHATLSRVAQVAAKTDKSDRTAAAACFATIERSSGKLLLGRLDLGGSSLVVALPLKDELEQLLYDWEQVLADSKASLQRTTDAEAVGKWTDAEKRDWWSERRDGDTSIQALLSRLESLLGPWKKLLCPNAPAVEAAKGNPHRFDQYAPTGFPSLAPVAPWIELLVGASGDGEPTTASESETAAREVVECLREVLEQYAVTCGGDIAQAGHAAQAIVGAVLGVTPPPAMMSADGGNNNDSDNVDDLTTALSAMKVTELRKRLKDEGLPTDGLKKELVSRVLTASVSAKKPSSRATDAGAGATVVSFGMDVMSTAKKPKQQLQSTAGSVLKAGGGLSFKTPGTKAKKKLSVFCDEDDAGCLLPPPPSTSHRRGANTSTKGVTFGGEEEETATAAAAAVAAATACDEGHVVLVLDERLQALPWECMPCLRKRQCSRVPSLALLLGMAQDLYLDQASKQTLGAYLTARVEEDEAKAEEQQENDKENSGVSSANNNTPVRSKSGAIATPQKSILSPRRQGGRQSSRSPMRDSRNSKSNNNSKFQDARVSLSKSWFAIDPEANLPNTRKTMTGFLQPYQKRYKWPGVVAEIPAEPEVRSRHDASHLFIFCGHGAGEKVCDGHRLKKCHCPAAMLWGCSSGRLAVQGLHDPAGVALQYLVWGAPFVLGNLWDVTDKDIDKLSVDCMERLFNNPPINSSTVGEKKTVSEALALSRGVCKMAYAVGSAPVMYGLPAAINA